MLCTPLLMLILPLLVMMVAGGQIQDQVKGISNKVLCSLLPDIDRSLCVETDGDFSLHTAQLRTVVTDSNDHDDGDDDRGDGGRHTRRKRETFSFTKGRSDEYFLLLHPRNQAPSINCSSIPDVVYTERAETSVVVSWKPATAYDNEDRVLSVNQTEGQSPGTVHAEGEHVVTYITRDRDGLAAFCSIAFTVAVRRCNQASTYIEHGNAQCNPGIHPNIYGSACSYTCKTGYQLVGLSKLQCDDQGRWTGDKPVCEAVTCGPPASVSNGYLVCEYPLHTYPSTCQLICQPGYTNSGEDNSISCQSSGQWTTVQPCTVTFCAELDSPQNSELSCSNGNTYNSVCTVTCHQDYVIEGESSRRCQANQTWSGKQPVCISTCPAPPSVSHGMYQCLSGHKYQDNCSLTCDRGYEPVGPVTINCDVNRQWSQPGSCLDMETPHFPDGCPEDMEVIAPPLGTPMIVTYTYPDVTDNSGEALTVVGSPPSGRELGLGLINVTVTATDSAGNKATCHFVINHKVLLCRDPNALVSGDDPIVYRCPQGVMDGAHCDVSCYNQSTAQLSSVTGPSLVQCGSVHGFDARQWTWSGDVAPYCIDSCSPGQMSATGNQPCQLCPLGTYQSEYGQTSCDVCPYSMSTLISGATSKNDCYFFDMRATVTFPRPIIQLHDTQPESFTITFWLHVKPQNPKMVLDIFLDPNKARPGTVYYTLDTFSVYIIPEEDTTSPFIRYWYHVALVFYETTITLYVNSKEVESVSGLYPANLDVKTIEPGFEGGSSIFFLVNTIYVSSFQMTGSALNVSEVHDLTTMCKKKLSSNVLAASSSLGTYSDEPSTCDDVNDCIDHPCGDHGTCLDDYQSFTCTCDSGWTGKLCDIPPDFCTSNACANGATCVSHLENSSYTCTCAMGYKGPSCNQEIVNGGWSDWGPWSSCSVACGSGGRSRLRECNNPSPDPTGLGCTGDKLDTQVCSGIDCPVHGGYGEWAEWSQCSATCGGGVSTRRRTCDNPAPSNGGKPCDAAYAAGSVQCNTVQCPECMALTKRDNQEDIECSLSQDKSMQECQVICPPGFSLVPDQTDNSFKCGRLTNYTWTHQTDRNPTALLPDCADQRLPTQTSVVLNYEYSNLTCNQPQLLTNLSMAIQTRFQQVSGCQQSDYCNQSVVVQTNCDTKTLDTRGESILSAYLNLTFYNTNQTLLALLSSMSEEDRASALVYAEAIEGILNQLTNDSSELLEVSVDSGQYRGQFATAQLKVNCPDNQAYYGGFCVDCPAGSYSAGNGSCLLCEPGFYQNQTGMSSCLPCPQCWSTPGVGSYSIQHCSVDICSRETSTSVVKSEDGFPLPEVLGVGGGVAFCAAIIFSLVWLVRRHREKARKKAHPYDIPGERGGAEDNPYVTAGDDPYDKIDEDPYATLEGLKDNQVSDGYIKVKHVDYSLDMGENGFSNGSYDLIDDGLRQPVGRPVDGVYAKRKLPPPGIFDDQAEIELRDSRSPRQEREGKVPSYLELLNTASDENSKDSAGRVPSYLELLNAASHEEDSADQNIPSTETDEQIQKGLQASVRTEHVDMVGENDNTGDMNDRDVSNAKEQPAPKLSVPDLTWSLGNDQSMEDKQPQEVTDQPTKQNPPVPHKPAGAYRKQDGQATNTMPNKGYITPV